MWRWRRAKAPTYVSFDENGTCILCLLCTMHPHVSSSQDVVQVKVYNNKSKSLELDKFSMTRHRTWDVHSYKYLVQAPNRYRSEIGLYQSSASESAATAAICFIPWNLCKHRGMAATSWPRIPEPNMIHIKYVFGSFIIYHPLTIPNIPWNTMAASAVGNPFFAWTCESARVRECENETRLEMCVECYGYRCAIASSNQSKVCSTLFWPALEI